MPPLETLWHLHEALPLGAAQCLWGSTIFALSPPRPAPHPFFPLHPLLFSLQLHCLKTIFLDVSMRRNAGRNGGLDPPGLHVGKGRSVGAAVGLGGISLGGITGALKPAARPAGRELMPGRGARAVQSQS